VTKPLASALGAENLIVVWAVMLVGVVGLAIPLASGSLRPPPQRRRGRATEQLIEGLRYVRSSPLMRWMALGAMMFSLLFFSLYLPFSRAATARYPSPDRLAGFFGVFFGVSTAIALVMSLFVTNRILRRFGVPTVLLVLPMLYVAAFGTLIVVSTFVILAAFRFAQVVWMQGGASSAFESVVNTVPVSHRDQTRAFLYGGPTQAGTVAAGVVALVGQHASPRFLYAVGFACAVVATVAMAKVRRAYAHELVVALREGRPNVFGVGPGAQEPFDLGRLDSAAVSVAIDGLSDPDAHVRRLAADILGNLEPTSARVVLVAALRDEDTEVRTAALRSLARAGTPADILVISRRLSDPQPEVRVAALDALSSLGSSAESVSRRASPLLQDPDPVVRAQAASLLLDSGPDVGAELLLLDMAAATQPADTRVAAFRALAVSKSPTAYGIVGAGLHDPSPAVRAVAAHALAAIDPEAAIEPLIDSLADPNASVREAVAEALGAIGHDAVARILPSLFDPASQAGALSALEKLPINGARDDVRRFAAQSVSRAVESRRLAALIEEDSDEALALLRASLLARSQREAVFGLRAAALMGDRNALSVAIENVSVTDPAQRANALEVIETVGEPELVRPLLGLWDGAPTTGSDRESLERLADDPDDWIRACAEFALPAREGGSMTRTLTTLPLMERVLFLRKVPLFADLPPSDLRPIASIAEEDAFADGETLATEGEPGDAMHIIVSGEVLVRRGAGGQSLAVRGPGEVIGEMAVIASQPRMASLVARGSVRVVTLEQREFTALLRERPEISLAVMRVLCQRLAVSDAEQP
jgi:HEAT repeat protein